MIAGSLFSGVGGLDHGLARAGFRHGFFCESDPWRRTVLAAHWPGVPVYDDVASLGLPHVHMGTGRGGRDAERAGRADLATVDLLCGGFPCQDVSVAGQRRGLAGNRSGLFYEFARIIDALRPRWILVENVPGLFSSNGGRDFGAVVGTLADLGYGVGWRVLDSRFFGVPQRRRRVFILGTVAVGDPRAAAERCGQVLTVGTRCDRHPPTGTEAGPAVTPALAGRSATRLDDQGTGQLVAATLKAKRGKGGGGLDIEETLIADTVRSHPRPGSNSNGNLVAATLSSGGHPNSNTPGRRKEDDENLVAFLPTGGGAKGLSASDDFAPGTGTGTGGTVAVAQSSMVRRLTPTECERLQALPDGWTNPDGTAPDSRRYAALGDAVTSSVGEWIGQRIIAADSHEAAA